MKDLPFTENHHDFRSRLRRFLDTDVSPHVDRWEADHKVPREIWRKMGRAGFLCPTLPEQYGGLGGDFLHAVIVIQELVRTNHTGLFAQLHSDVVVPYIESFGNEAQKGKFLPGCASGDIVTAVAMTEPDAGSDLASMTTTAVEEGDEVVLNGSKTFISNGRHCDLTVVAAKDPSVSSPHKAVSLYLVEDGTPGFKKGACIEKFGMHSQDTAELFFTDCRIPRENRLGEKGRGFIMLMQKLQQERLVCAVWPLAIAENIFNWTVNHLQTGSTPPPGQAVSFALVEIKTDLCFARAFLNDLIMTHIQKQEAVVETSMAKFWITDKANEIANRCLDITGALGASERCPMVRMWRDVRVHTIFAGTNEIMKGIIAKSMGF